MWKLDFIHPSRPTLLGLVRVWWGLHSLSKLLSRIISIRCEN